jgi:hypothetical protein
VNYTIEKCKYTVYTLDTPYTSMCILVVYLYTTKNEAVNPLTPRKYTVLNGNFVFDLPDFDLQNVFRNVSLAQNETCLYKNTQANSYPHNTLPTG